jgi:predicted transcriptional regulator
VRTSLFFPTRTPQTILADEAQIADLSLWVKFPRQESSPQLKLFSACLDRVIEIIYRLSIKTRIIMARFMISMPDDMLKKLDDAAHKEHRSRSELLREAARRHLNMIGQVEAAQVSKSEAKHKIAKKISKASLRERLLDLGVGQRGCPGLDRLAGPVTQSIDMRRLLKISKRLTGLSRDIIESRQDRW